MTTVVSTQRPAGFRVAFGLALILVGQPIAWFVRGQFFQSESPVFPAIPVLIGVVLILSRAIEPPVRLQVHPTVVASYALLWPMAMSAMSLVEPMLLLTDWAYGFVVVVVMVGLSLVPREELENLPIAILLVGSVSCALPLYELATGSLVESALRLALQGNSNTLVVGMVGGLTMLTALLVLLGSHQRSFGLGLLISVAFITGLGCVVLSNTRSVVLAIIYCLALILFVLVPAIRAQPAIRPKRRSQAGMVVFLVLVAGAAVMGPVAGRIALGEEGTEKFIETVILRFEGSVGLFQPSRYSFVDASTQSRVDTIRETFDGISLFGQGISAQIRANKDGVELAVYPHVTYLQAVYDLGIVGGLLFAVLHLVVPVWLILQRLREDWLDWASGFAILYYAYAHVDHLTHGTPYNWFTTMPIALLFVLLPRPSGLPTTGRLHPLTTPAG